MQLDLLEKDDARLKADRFSFMIATVERERSIVESHCGD